MNEYEDEEFYFYDEDYENEVTNGYEIALQRIEECKLTQSTELDLSGLNLKEVPEDIIELKWLTNLDLGVNRLAVIPPWIGELQLFILQLYRNEIESLPEEIGECQSLIQLNLRDNYLKSLPTCIEKLRSLESLYIGQNQITSLPEWIGKLQSLVELNLGSNYITILPDSLGKLHSLKNLYLDNNRLVNLPTSIGNLHSLTHLWLWNNHLTKIPYSITYLSYLENLDLTNNPDLQFPSELLENSLNPHAIFDYIRATHLDRTVLIDEVKVLVVGEAEVGKTALVRTLLGETVDIEKRDPTPGIVVRDDKIIVKGREMVGHFWDFGGQEIMHNTHRLFLTTRSCYLLVLDATQNEEASKVVDWLKTIHLYAPDAPVILVINKWDKFKLRLNVPALEQHHPITAVIETSCATKAGIELLRNTLQEALGTLKHLDDEIPAKWMEVRKQVGAENRDYLEYQEFEAICAAHEVIEGTYNSVADLLHALGVLFTYSNNPNTKLTHILNPNWVTGGIYPVLNDPDLLQGQGFVTDGDIARVLDPKGYSRDKHIFILSMMFVFELAYRLEEGRYLVPDLLPKSPPFYEWQEKGALRFVYHYDFVPPGLFSRFVVRMRDEVNPDQVWRTGVILHQLGQPYGRVTLDTDAKRIEIAIALPERNHLDPRTFLDMLRARFKRLHDDYAGVEVQELVPIRDSGAFVDYADLLFWAEHGKYEQLSRVAGPYDVRELLQGISARPTPYLSLSGIAPSEAEQLRQRRKQLIAILGKTVGSTSLEWELFLDSAGLIRYHAKLNFALSHEDTCHLLVRTLEKAGKDQDTGKQTLWLLMAELRDRNLGHDEVVGFLQAWMRELG